jgi:VIT1/CCC1 family predicted Fe2+/Mn2+ transporter
LARPLTPLPATVVTKPAHTAEAEGLRLGLGEWLSEDDAGRVANSIKADKKRWVDFMMRFELGLEEPDPKRAGRSALTISLAYIAGGLIPLAPYFFFSSVRPALLASIVVTLLALLVFGYIKGLFTTGKPVRSALQTVIVGGLAASAAFAIAKALG